MEKPRKLPSGKWQARVTDANGKRIPLGTHHTKKAAQDAIAAASTDIKRNLWDDGTRGVQTFAEYSKLVHEIRKADLAVRSALNYESALRIWLNPSFGTKRLRDITKLDVDLWWARTQPTPGRRAAYMTLSNVLRYAVDAEEIVKSPARVRGAGKDVSKPRPTLTFAHFHALLDQCSADMQTFLLVTLGSSMRLGEVLGLDRADVDLDTGDVHIHQQSVWEPGGTTLAEPKYGSERHIALPHDVLVSLRAYVKRHPFAADALFVNAKGARLSRKLVYKDWHAARASVGLSWVHIHDLRHTSITKARQDKIPEEQVMARAGHRDMRTMMRYSHATAEGDRGIAAALNAALKETA